MHYVHMLDTTSSEANDLIAAGHAEPKCSLAHQLALLANELRYERDQAEQQKDAALKLVADRQLIIDNAFERAARTAASLAASLGHDDVMDEEERFFAEGRGPTPANEKFVSAMAAIEPDEADIAEALEQAELEEQAWRNVDDNASLGLSMGGGL